MAIGMTKIDATVIEAAEPVAISAIEWASDTGGTVLNAAVTEWFSVVNIQVSVTFGTSATGDALVHIRKSADSGTTKDTEKTGTYAMTIPVTAATTITKTLDVYDFDYLDVAIENEDAAVVITGWSAKYTGVKITGMA